MTDRYLARCGFVFFFVLGSAMMGPRPGAAQTCPGEECRGDFNCDNQVTINEILISVNNALDSCPAISPDQACTDLATAQCSKLDQCIVNGTTSRYGGAAICQARQKQACLTRLGAAGTGNNPADVALCVQQLPTAPCAEFDLGSIPECQARVGTVANGQPCTFPGQCQSSNCAIVNGTNCGTCAAANQAGDSCVTTSCSHGLFCVNTTQQCQPRGELNGTCDADHPCGAGLSCVTPSGAPSGTCEAAGTTIGTTCDPKRETAPSCDPNFGLYCNGTSKTCQAVTYATAGGQCGFVSPIVINCANDATCFGAQGPIPGMCVANADDGMPCDTQLGPSCLPPARCVTGNPSATSGVCQLPDPAACG